MEDETLSNILTLLQNSNATNQAPNKATTSSANNEIQTMLIKFLLSGGLNQFMNFNQNNTPNSSSNIEEKKRTIDLKNYQRLD